MRPRLSAITITKNSERTLDRTLGSLSFADEIIVVDAKSTDRTVEIARRHTDAVYINRWPGYGAQKNFGREKASGEWLLFIDADEEVLEPLQHEILREISKPHADFVWIKIVTIFLGRPLRHLYGHNLRLFRNNAGRWDSKRVHEQVIRNASGRTVRLLETDSVVLSTPLLHHSHPTIASYLTRMERYTTLDAEEMLRINRDRMGKAVHVSLNNPVSRFVFLWSRAGKQLIRRLLKQRGILDGRAGIIWSFLSAWYEHVMCKKYLSLRKSRS